jgi:hypothetical protein
MNVTREELESVGLWFRELFYLEQIDERPLPAFSFSEVKAGAIPEGWVQVNPRFVEPEVVRGWEFRLSFELVRRAWTEPVLSDSFAERRWMDACNSGTSVWGVFTCSRPVWKMMGLSRRSLWKLAYLRRNNALWGRRLFTTGKGVWKPPTEEQGFDAALVYCRCGRVCGGFGQSFHRSSGDCGQGPPPPVALLEWQGENYRACPPPAVLR